MSYKVPSFNEALQFAIGFWKGLFPLSNVSSRFSYHYKRLKAYVGVATDLHAHIDSAQRDIFPLSSTGPYLARWASAFGLEGKGGTPARKDAALRVSGTAGAAVSVGDELTSLTTGLRFQANSAGVVVVPPGYVDVDIVGIDVGSQTQLKAGEQLQFVAPAAGVSAIAKLVRDLDQDGFDAELDSALSGRLAERIGEAQTGGNQTDFEQWALQVQGVSYAFCYPNRAGIGTVDVAALHTGSGQTRTLSTTERAALLAYIQTKASSQVGGTGGSLRVLTTTVDNQNIEVTLTPSGAQAYAFDWDDTTPPVVLAWTAGTRTLQFTVDRPGSMLAGHRIMLRGVASAQDGAQFVIQSLSGTDSVVLQSAPAVAPAPTDVVYSGGPLVDIVRDALISHANGDRLYADNGAPLAAAKAGSKVNLKVLAEGIGPANPAGVYGTWSGALLVSVLDKIATYPTGVRKAVVITPAVDYEATDFTFPNDNQIGLITPASVLVRRG